MLSSTIFALLVLAVGGECYSSLKIDASTSNVTAVSRSRSRRAIDTRTTLESRGTSWSYVGCFGDDSNIRTLSVYADVSNTTPQVCEAKCQSMGYKYAGVQYGFQCYCGNTITSGRSVAESQCDYGCQGDGNQKCGGFYRISIYQSVTTIDVPTSLGCYLDGTDRTLKGPSTYNGGLTPGSCFDFCGKQGYAYVGLEYGAECYCGSSAPATSRQLSSGECSMRCGGDSNSQCGGTWRMNVWQLPVCDSKITTNCAYPAGYKPPATTTVVPTTASPTTAVPAPTGTGTAYVGCYIDGTDRTLTGASTWQGDLTPSKCFAFCKGFAYAGTEYSGECYCGNTAPLTSRKVVDSDCSSKCYGDSSSICGGTYRISVYRLGTGSTTTATTTTTTLATIPAPTTTASVPAPTGKNLPAGISSIGCFKDAASMGFNSYVKNTAQTPSICVQYCKNLGYNFAGIQGQSDCYCSNRADWSAKQADSGCNYACSGDNGYACGGNGRMSVYSGSSQIVTGAAQPASGGRKYLWAHYMVGNTESHTPAIWAEDVKLAAAAGIDGFALNMGQASWQIDRVATAYQTAYDLRATSPFQLFLSFDMTAMYCQSTDDAKYLAGIVSRFAANPYQAKYQGKVLVTTFAGDQCRFGRGSALEGWNYFRSILTDAKISIYLMPSLFVGTYTNPWYDGHFDWDSAWPKTAANLDTSRDQAAISTLNSMSKGYMANISPAFFTYYGTSGQFAYNKNWIYRGDNWLLATRFESLISMRGQFDMIELTSWNDFGESHHIGPIRSEQPGSQRWVNGLPHTAWLSLIAYYAPAWKNGAYASTSDKIIVWSRPHPKNGTPTNPTLGRPRDADFTDDNLYALVLLSSPAEVTIQSGDTAITFPGLPAGVSKVSLASRPGTIGGQISRGGSVVTRYLSDGAFSYSNTFSDWNFNYFVATF